MRKAIGWCARLIFVGILALGLPSRAWGPPQGELLDKLSQGLSVGSSEARPLLLGMERRKLVNDVYEYTYQLQVGPGQYDVIGLHRVVRETFAYTPAPNQKALFMVHGDVWGFRGAFMASVDSDAVPVQQSVAIYLAQRGVDVWGIDLRWVSVPPQETDFTFMKDWNLGMHAQDVGVGIGFARLVRLLTFNGAGPVTLLGWSRGAAVSYAYLNMEAQWSADKRQVSGYIPVDMAYMFDPKDTNARSAACTGYALLSKVQKGGSYEGGRLGQTLQDVGAYASSAPQLISPLLAPLTNHQAAQAFGVATFMLQGVPVIQGYHFVGGPFTVDNSTVIHATGLTYTSDPYFMEILQQASPFQSVGEQVDTLALWCGAPAVPYNDHLRQVNVPVLYLGAAGGTGRNGLYTLAQLGSKDITVHLVQLQNDNSRSYDFGHMDLWSASNAATVAWPYIIDWLEHH